MFYFKNKYIYNNISYFWMKNRKSVYTNNVKKNFHHLYKKITLFTISMYLLKHSNIKNHFYIDLMVL